MNQAELANQIIKPSKLLNPYQIIKILNEAAAADEHKYLRIYNKRSNKNVYLLHKGTKKFLFRDPKYIEVLSTQQAAEVLFRINKLIKESKYLDFEINYENVI